jgi:transposase
VAELEAQVEKLTRLVEQLQRGAKRQAAPFSRGQPVADPKPPGRKPGAAYGVKAHRPPPAAEQIDEVHEAALPEACVDCGGRVVEDRVEPQYQVEIPRRPIHRRFNVHIGHCARCGTRVQGRHPLQTSEALGAAASQLGPDAQAALVEWNKHLGLSHGKAVACLERLFGIRLTRGGAAQVILRAARRLQPVYQQLCHTVRRARQVVPDETGWRIGGRSAWLHVLVARRATVYTIGDRSSAAAMSILGAEYSGVLVHDGWAPYDQFQQARHQQCLQHLLRRCAELLEVATRRAADFPQQVTEQLRAALALRDRYASGQISRHGLAVARGGVRERLSRLLWPPLRRASHERLAAHLWNHFQELFTFLSVPGTDATNWRAEHALRFAVVNRKVWGGNRTPGGGEAQAILLSVWRTCWQHGQCAIDFLSQLLRGQATALPLPP